MYKIKEENLSALFRKIADMQDLYLPIQEAGQTSFGMWSETAQVDLAACKTVKSPKDLFFPQSETLYTVKTENRKFSIRPEKQEDRAFTVFGIRACDLRGIEILDQVFLEEPADSYYAARRAHGTVVSYACHAPEETCFCSVFGIDCADPQADVTIWKLEDVFYWREVTEKGKTLTDLVKDVLETVSSEEIQCVETEKEQIRNVVTQLPYSTLSLEGWGRIRCVKRLILRCGNNCISLALPAERVHSFVLPVSATISEITILAMAYSGIAAGIPVCILILQ